MLWMARQAPEKKKLDEVKIEMQDDIILSLLMLTKVRENRKFSRT